jgi:hypothetical protein
MEARAKNLFMAWDLKWMTGDRPAAFCQVMLQGAGFSVASQASQQDSFVSVDTRDRTDRTD